ncbi:MAG: hypothetical protein EXR53_06465 [Dehalococcoidia bacterium]|nr:hypothetical protein [Dehalococcoidia bacterium]
MPGDMMTIVQMCGVCRTEIATIQVKKENMMLSTTAKVWCPNCKAQRPEIRDAAGRLAAIQTEVATYPKSDAG